MSKYRKKPVVIDAFKWTGGVDQEEDPDWAVEAMRRDLGEIGRIWIINSGTPAVELKIHTLEGYMSAKPGDYVIRGVAGEIYPCKPDIFEATFEATYEPV